MESDERLGEYMYSIRVARSTLAWWMWVETLFIFLLKNIHYASK